MDFSNLTDKTMQLPHLISGASLKDNINFLAAAAQTTPSTSVASITDSIKYLLVGGGLMMAVWGIVQLTQSGRGGDSQGKIDGSWLIFGGLAIAGIGAGTMIAGILSAPPGS